MKEVVLVLLGIFIGRQLMAQTFSEWFRQNHTQLKYLGAQITALREYDGVLRAGYAVARDGLGSVLDIGEDDLDLHSRHFAALEMASPAASEDAVVGAIRQYFVLLPVVAEEIAAALPEMGPSIARGLRETAVKGEQWLENLLTAGRLSMDDAGRLSELNGMYRQLRVLFGNAVLLLSQLEYSSVNPLL